MRTHRTGRSSGILSAIARAAEAGVALAGLTVTVDSESDDRGILGIDTSIPAGPLSMKVVVLVAATPPSAPAQTVREMIERGLTHCPVDDSIRRAVPMEIVVEIG